MKPIIVTYSNESWIVELVSWLSIMNNGVATEVPSSGHYICKHITTNETKRVGDNEIKLIARRKKTNQ